MSSMVHFLLIVIPLSLVHIVGAVQVNCTAGSAPCGTSLTCCPITGYQCLSPRGIPLCESDQEEVRGGFFGPQCGSNPYLYDCSLSMGGSGCCPIGTLCFYGSLRSSQLICIDAHGTEGRSYPLDTTGFIPPATVVANSDPTIAFSPQDSWNVSSSVPNCTSSASVHVTSTINSNITFNYTGTSIRIHTVRSPRGGVFAVIVDGFNTTSTIDTFSNDSTLPLCYPVQYPPFIRAPPNLAATDQHSITLMYTGPSPNAPNGTSSEIRFDSFSIPDLQSPGVNSGSSLRGRKLISFTTVALMIMAVSMA